MYLYPPGEDHGPAGDTGSAMHKAAEAFHKGSSLAESIEAMKANTVKYPLADLADAASMFLTYATDPRNREAKIVLVEQPIRFRIAAAPEDHTQKAIEVEGTVDQVREDFEGLWVHDIKTSKMDPMSIVHESMYQQAGYCIGAAIALNRPVRGARIIMPRQYAKSKEPGTAPVFWDMPWRWDDIADIMMAMRHQVAAIRAGRLYHVPNDSWCRWCHMRGPENCLPPLRMLRLTYNGKPIPLYSQQVEGQGVEEVQLEVSAEEARTGE